MPWETVPTCFRRNFQQTENSQHLLSHSSLFILPVLFQEFKIFCSVFNFSQFCLVHQVGVVYFETSSSEMVFFRIWSWFDILLFCTDRVLRRLHKFVRCPVLLWLLSATLLVLFDLFLALLTFYSSAPSPLQFLCSLLMKSIFVSPAAPTVAMSV